MTSRIEISFVGSESSQRLSFENSTVAKSPLGDQATAPTPRKRKRSSGANGRAVVAVCPVTLAAKETTTMKRPINLINRLLRSLIEEGIKGFTWCSTLIFFVTSKPFDEETTQRQVCYMKLLDFGERASPLSIEQNIRDRRRSLATYKTASPSDVRRGSASPLAPLHFGVRARPLTNCVSNESHPYQPTAVHFLRDTQPKCAHYSNDNQ